jgi:hypothetical protein
MTHHPILVADNILPVIEYIDLQQYQFHPPELTGGCIHLIVMGEVWIFVDSMNSPSFKHYESSSNKSSIAAPFTNGLVGPVGVAG